MDYGRKIKLKKKTWAGYRKWSLGSWEVIMDYNIRILTTKNTQKNSKIYKLLYANDNLKHKMKSNHVLITIDYTIP